MSEITLIWIMSSLQVLIALGLVNVWLVRFNKKTKYRGKGAGNMKEEFAAYGLPSWFVYVIGFLKMIIAAIMIVGLFMPQIMYPYGFSALALLAVLMVGAITMHIKVRDPLVRIVPAISMFAMSLLGIYFLAIF